MAAGLWILFSDKLLASLISDRATLTRLSILKGWLFVIVTAVLLYILIRNHTKALQDQFRPVGDHLRLDQCLIYVADLATYEILYLNKFGSTLFGENWRGKYCYEIFQADQKAPCPFCSNE